jgi:hypothetical protein
VSSVPANIQEGRIELNRRCNAIEECYEFMLAYAAQGLADDQGNSQVREFLRRCDEGLTDLAGFLKAFVEHLNLDNAQSYAGFLSVLDRDALDSRAAVQLGRNQPARSGRSWC